MSTSPAPLGSPLTSFEQLRRAREIIRCEGQALLDMAGRLDSEICEAVELVIACQGSVLVVGMGKAGLIGQKLSATLASTGTPSHFVHPAEAIHGDLGRITADDLLIVLSQSGRTEEIVRILPSIEQLGNNLIAITGHPESELGKTAHVTLDLGPIEEAGQHGLAPSTSTAAMLAMGDALALVVSQVRKFQAEDFARCHPGGSLGRRLAKVEQIMRPIDQCRTAPDNISLREVLVAAGRPGRRSGAIMLIKPCGQLSGIFTDSDLARLLESPALDALDQPVSDVMTKSPTTARCGQKLADAVDVLALRKISELPVIDDNGSPLGMIDITDVVALLPREAADSSNSPQTDVASDTKQKSTLPFSNPQAGDA